MKQLLYALSSICLVSCSPKLSPVIKDNQPPLPDSAFVLVLDQGDRFNDNNNAIGIINSSDNSSFTDCTYDEVIAGLRQRARSHGANLIKVISYKKPDQQNACGRIIAKIYKVDNVKLYETKFEWSSNRKLTWEDYKGTPAPHQEANVAATTSCRFGLLATPPGSTKVSVTNEFICHQSSVRPGQKKPELLAHEQLHFDLCEVYARKLRKELAATPLTPADVMVLSRDAFIKTYKLYKESQFLYDQETNHGLNPQAQTAWKHKVEEELEALAAYTR